MEGTIEGIALKREYRQPLEPVDAATVTPEGGLDGNVRQSEDRRVTFIGTEQWDETQAEVGTDLPWHIRRANILTKGLRMPDLAGKRLVIGEAIFEVTGETDPCKRMDEIHLGLKDGLMPDWRGGVCTRVIRGGAIRVGDTVRVEG